MKMKHFSRAEAETSMQIFNILTHKCTHRHLITCFTPYSGRLKNVHHTVCHDVCWWSWQMTHYLGRSLGSGAKFTQASTDNHGLLWSLTHTLLLILAVTYADEMFFNTQLTVLTSPQIAGAPLRGLNIDFVGLWGYSALMTNSQTRCYYSDISRFIMLPGPAGHHTEITAGRWTHGNLYADNKLLFGISQRFCSNHWSLCHMNI